VIEVHGVVREAIDGSNWICDVNDENPEFFSAYAHLCEGGVECIGDFKTHQEAIDYAKHIAEQHIYDVVNYFGVSNGDLVMVSGKSAKD
jgi:hypothetical protein